MDACSFQDTCTGEAGLDYMDGISDACAAGDCDCTDMKYHNFLTFGVFTSDKATQVNEL